jgi:class 3 adenylate cyclase
MRIAAAILAATPLLSPLFAAVSPAPVVSAQASATPTATVTAYPSAPLGVVTPIPGSGEAMAEFVQLIDERIDARSSPEDMAKIDATIKAKYEKPMAVMITDMTGMTSQTKKSGIIAFFTAIREMQREAVPAIDKNGAKWIKIDADDLFVVHSSAKALFQTAHDLDAAIAKYNKDEKKTMALAIGLSFGPTLVIGDEELWGDPVNVASKLGEDTAEPGEILVSEEFLAALKAEGAKPECTLVTAKARKLKFPYYSCK